MSASSSSNLPDKLVLVPDTNIFEEAKDLRELPWEELASQEIRLLVCPSVMREIDEHKTSQKRRQQERARKWNPEFKKLLTGGAPLLLKESGPRVTLEIRKVNSAGSSQSILDLTEPDDQLVDWTIRYRNANLGEDVRLFTGDTGPLGKAFDLGLPYIDCLIIGALTWGLPTIRRRYRTSKKS